MGPVLASIGQLAAFGVPLIIIGIVLVVASFVLVIRQRAVAKFATTDNFEDDPTVARLSKLGRAALWIGIIVAFVGVIVMVAPAWSTVV